MASRLQSKVSDLSKTFYRLRTRSKRFLWLLIKKNKSDCRFLGCLRFSVAEKLFPLPKNPKLVRKLPDVSDDNNCDTFFCSRRVCDLLQSCKITGEAIGQDERIILRCVSTRVCRIKVIRLLWRSKSRNSLCMVHAEVRALRMLLAYCCNYY